MRWRRRDISLLEKLFTEKIIFPFLDYLKDAVVILKRDGRIAEVNDASCGLLGLQKDEIAGRDYRDFKLLGALEESVTRCAAKKAEQAEQVSHGNVTLSATILPVMLEDELSRISIIIRDITQFAKVEHELIRRNRELMVINTVSSAFISSGDIDRVYDELLEKVMLTSDFGAGWLVFVDNGGYSVKSSYGVSLDFKNKLADDDLNGLYEGLIRSSEPLYIIEAGELPEVVRKEGVVFLAMVPLRVGKNTVGFLALANRTEIDFDFDLASLLSLIGNSLSLISEKLRLFHETQRLAVTDSLTGLYNARFFYSALDAEIARTKRYETPFSIVLFDIDNFKLINDTLGHQAGDEVLRSVADSMKDSSRKSDMVARYGGEEFIAILPSTRKLEAFNISNRIKETVESGDFSGASGAKVTLSGGIATFPDDAEDAKDLLYAADMAMYQAKAAGKKRIICYKKAK